MEKDRGGGGWRRLRMEEEVEGLGSGWRMMEEEKDGGGGWRKRRRRMEE